MAADQFALFASQARDYQPAPDLDRDKFEIMLTEFDKTAGQYRSAQTALTAGDRPDGRCGAGTGGPAISKNQRGGAKVRHAAARHLP